MGHTHESGTLGRPPVRRERRRRGIVDAETIDRESARRALENNDTYPLLAAADAHVQTGETGTNVNDLRVLLVGSPEWA